MTKQKHFFLIRGLIREKGHWGSFLKELKSCFPEAKVTTIDIPGAGDYYTSSSPLSIGGMVEQMRQDYVKARGENEDRHLIAISLGGMIGVQWMKMHGSDFDRATFINTSFGGLSPVYDRLFPSAFLFLLKVPVLKGRSKESRILELVTNHPDIFHDTLNMWEEISTTRPVSLANTLRQLMAAARFSIGDWRPSIPVMIIASTKDRMVNVRCSRTIAERWRLPIVEHPTGGHDLTVDDPAWVAKSILEGVEKKR